MAACLEWDRTSEPDVAQDGGPHSPPLALPRCCKVLEYGTDCPVALLYIFYSVEPSLARRFRMLGAPALRIPGKGWRHAVDFRAGDLLQLIDGRIAIVEKLVAAPCLGDICGRPVERMHSYVAGEDGIWKRSGHAQRSPTQPP